MTQRDSKDAQTARRLRIIELHKTGLTNAQIDEWLGLSRGCASKAVARERRREQTKGPTGTEPRTKVDDTPGEPTTDGS